MGGYDTELVDRAGLGTSQLDTLCGNAKQEVCQNMIFLEVKVKGSCIIVKSKCAYSAYKPLVSHHGSTADDPVLGTGYHRAVGSNR